jgi:site-specific DNA recombinase
MTSTPESDMDAGIQILELARNAQSLFEQQVPREKRRLLSFLLSNCASTDGQVEVAFRQSAAGAPFPAKTEIWLGREDSNLRMTESKSVALPLGDAPHAA